MVKLNPKYLQTEFSVGKLIISMLPPPEIKAKTKEYSPFLRSLVENGIPIPLDTKDVQVINGDVYLIERQ